MCKKNFCLDIAVDKTDSLDAFNDYCNHRIWGHDRSLQQCREKPKWLADAVEKDQEVVHQSVTNSLCNAIGCLSESRLTVNVAV